MLQQNLHFHAMNKYYFPKIKSKNKTRKQPSQTSFSLKASGKAMVAGSCWHSKLKIPLRKRHCVDSEGVNTLEIKVLENTPLHRLYPKSHPIGDIYSYFVDLYFISFLIHKFLGSNYVLVLE